MQSFFFVRRRRTHNAGVISLVACVNCAHGKKISTGVTSDTENTPDKLAKKLTGMLVDAQDARIKFANRTVEGLCDDILKLQKQAADLQMRGLKFWCRLPLGWQQLYAAPRRLSYDAARFDFVSIVREMLHCPSELPLARLHELCRPPDFEPCPPLRRGMNLAGMPFAKRKKALMTKSWLNSAAYRNLKELYGEFIRHQILPALALEFGQHDLQVMAQSAPVLRVVMPSAHVATKIHKDADYGHIPAEINFWMPLAPSRESNTLFVESFPGRCDYKPFEGDVGHIFRWWGNQCAHYCGANSINSTRVSLDFRVVPRELWELANTTGELEQAKKHSSVHWLAFSHGFHVEVL